MRTYNFGLIAMLAVMTLATLAGTQAAAQQEKVLQNFSAYSASPSVPYAGVIFDKAGNLYGATAEGGFYREGAVFEMTPRAGGGWTETLLHSFSHNGTDGWFPLGGLTLDAAGNLYGTTIYGGANGSGTVFELSPATGGEWTETILHTFNPNTDGSNPQGTLVFDAQGNLYGFANNGVKGTNCSGGCGEVFELTPQFGGGWGETIVHTFTNNGVDGYNPVGVIFDAKGNLYGTTTYGGTANAGTVFKLSPQAGGGWSETILHNFSANGTDGSYPYAGVVFDSKGNLYGTTPTGGTVVPGTGTVYELSPAAGGTWTERILYNFNPGTGAPIYPFAIPTFDAKGNLYCTTQQGGAYGWGSVFELKPTKSGPWIESVVHNFENNQQDGTQPYAGLTLGPSGYLYGTTGTGGTKGGGTVFEIIVP
jgi:uncharacterized repeat protein (TIGR03803 family)